jgi:hypothetical protein
MPEVIIFDLLQTAINCATTGCVWQTCVRQSPYAKRLSSRHSGLTTIQRCSVPPGTAERVDDVLQAGGQGTPVPSSLPHQSTTEPTPQ